MVWLFLLRFVVVVVALMGDVAKSKSPINLQLVHFCLDRNIDKMSVTTETRHEGLEVPTAEAPNSCKEVLLSTDKNPKMLFAMMVGRTTLVPEIKNHFELPEFKRYKQYASKLKPDLARLRLEITRRWRAYGTSYHPKWKEPRPSQWNFTKCLNWLHEHPLDYNK